ncbi:MAG: hypothetical protein ACE5KH_00405 [Candidatus Geothermarchaeales archaeon]
MVYQWVVLLHIASVLGFALAHGISMGVALMLRTEREPERVRVLLDLSRVSIAPTGVFMLLVLGTGVALGFMGEWWGSLWIWATLATILVVWGAMSLLGTQRYDEARMALGLDTVYGGRKKPTDEASSSAGLDEFLSGSQPVALTAIGVVALILILWLMLFKPF